MDTELINKLTSDPIWTFTVAVMNTTWPVCVKCAKYYMYTCIKIFMSGYGFLFKTKIFEDTIQSYF